jgi:hypothetical protein
MNRTGVKKVGKLGKYNLYVDKYSPTNQVITNSQDCWMIVAPSNPMLKHVKKKSKRQLRREKQSEKRRYRTFSITAGTITSKGKRRIKR